MVDYIIVWQEDKAKVHNVKVIPNEECVPKHKLLVYGTLTLSREGITATAYSATLSTQCESYVLATESQWTP